MKRFASILFFLWLPLAVASAAVNVDSTLSAIEDVHQEKRTEIRLDLAYRLSKNNLEAALEQADIAFEEAVEQNNEFYQAQAVYYKGLAYYYVSSADSAMIFLQDALQRFQALQDNYYTGMTHYYIGTSYIMRDADQEKAMEEYYKAIPYCLESDNFRILGAIYSSVGTVFRMNGNYENALEWTNKAKKYYELAGFTEGIAWIYYCMGRLYDSMRLFNEAEDAFLKSLEIYRGLAAEDGNLNGISICLDQLCTIYIQQNKLDKARAVNREAFNNYTASGSEYGISNTYKNFASIESHTGNYSKALEYLDKSLHIKKKLNDKLGLPGLYDHYGTIYTELEETQRAIDSLNIGLDLATANKQESLIIRLTGHLADAYAINDNYRIAYAYKNRQYNKFQAMNNLKSSRNMVQISSIFELEKNQERIKALEQENRIKEMAITRQKTWRIYLSLIIISITIALLMIMFLYYRNSRTTRDLDRKNKELRCLYNFYAVMDADEADKMWQTFVETIPQALRYPERVAVRLTFNNLVFATRDLCEAGVSLKEAVSVFGHDIGYLQVTYENSPKEKKLSFDREEKNLIALLCKHINSELENQTSTQSLIESERKLRESNATKDKFFSIIAHDLRSPYNSILGFSKILKEAAERGNTKDAAEFSNLIYQSAQQSFSLLNNLLQWSRSQTGAISFNPDYVSMLEIVNDNVKLMHSSFENKNLDVRISVADDMLYADRNIIDTVLRNLLSNAIKYSYGNGHIQILGSADMTKKTFSVTIKDDGVGIPPENIHRLFKLEETVTTDGTDKEKGTGLGLILCKEFLDIHGGSISAGNNDTTGAAFTFSIPMGK